MDRGRTLDRVIVRSWAMFRGGAMDRGGIVVMGMLWSESWSGAGPQIGAGLWTEEGSLTGSWPETGLLSLARSWLESQSRPMQCL